MLVHKGKASILRFVRVITAADNGAARGAKGSLVFSSLAGAADLRADAATLKQWLLAPIDAGGARAALRFPDLSQSGAVYSRVKGLRCVAADIAWVGPDEARRAV